MEAAVLTQMEKDGQGWKPLKRYRWPGAAHTQLKLGVNEG